MATIETNARPTASIGAWFQGLRRDLSTEMKRRRVYSQTHEQLMTLTDRELADIGISRLQIADIARDAAYGQR